MAPKVSASKQKRLQEKAAKQAAKGSTTASSTPTGSMFGSEASTPMTSLSAAQSNEDLSAMAKLQIATDR